MFNKQYLCTTRAQNFTFTITEHEKDKKTVFIT